jgi:phage shock protein A
LGADVSRLREEIERAVAVGNPASAQPMLERHAKLARSLAAIEGQIAAAGEALTSAERDLKRLELGAAQRAEARAGRAPRAVPDRSG